MTITNQVFSGAQLIDAYKSTATYWTPQNKQEPTKNEVFTTHKTASGCGFVLALAEQHAAGRPWLWVQDDMSQRQAGKPFIHGIADSLRDGLHYLCTARCEDALFAMEEGLKCADLACVIGEISGDPAALDFTASRRLAVASETHGVPFFLIRGEGSRNLSAARMRWNITPAPSAPNRWNPRASGTPQWRADLFRTRLYRPGQWVVRYDDGQLTAARDHLDIATQSGDQSLAVASNG